MLADLGPDVHPLGHMDDVHRILKELLMAELRTRRNLGDLAVADISLCRFTAQVHDVGETTHPSFPETVDDIPSGLKQPWQRKIEQDVRLAVFSQFWGDIPQDFRDRADLIVMHRPETDRDIAAHDHLEAAHTIGSYVTGLVSGQLALQIMEDLDISGIEPHELPENEAHRLTQLRRLGTIVTRDMRPLVEDLSDEYDYAGMILEMYDAEFTSIDNQLAA
jgi:hypothetical protein